MKAPPKWTEMDLRMVYHLETVSTLTLNQAARLLTYVKQPSDTHSERYLPELPLVVRVSYPLSVDVHVTIHPYRIWSHRREDWSGPRMDIGYVLWTLANFYKDIYANHETYGVWGHAIGDLFFEGLQVNEDGTAELEMGS
jgi:hypothetical protein